MKKSVLIAIFIAVVAVIWVVSGTLGREDKVQTTSVSDRNGQAAKLEQKKASVRYREFIASPQVNDIVLTGITEASRTVTMRAEVEAMVTELTADKGDKVKQGDVILKLDARARKERVAEAKERVRQRGIEYNAAANLAQKGYNSRVRVAQAKADLEQARAALKQAELDLDNSVVKAPFDSVVFDTYGEVGDFLRIGDEIARLVDLDPIIVRGYVTEHHMGEIKKGNTARVVFIDKAELNGIISYVAPAANPETRTFAIEITIDNPELGIVEGMTVQIFIPTPAEDLYKISPSVLSLNDEGQTGVKILDQNNIVSFVPIRIVSDHADYMLIDGLPTKTAKIITVGQDFVSEGQKVEPTQSEGDGLL